MSRNGGSGVPWDPFIKAPNVELNPDAGGFVRFGSG